MHVLRSFAVRYDSTSYLSSCGKSFTGEQNNATHNNGMLPLLSLFSVLG